MISEAAEQEVIEKGPAETPYTAEDAAKNVEAGFLQATKGIEFNLAQPEPEPELKEEDVEAEKKEAEARQLIAGLNEDQLKTVLAYASSVPEIRESLKAETQKLYSKVGNLQQALNALKSQQPSAPAKLTKEAFGRVGEELPELAERLAEDLSNILLERTVTQTQPSEKFDPAPLEDRFSQELEKAKQDLVARSEMRLLENYHPDWKQKTELPEFNLWQATLPPEEQKELNETNDGLLLAKKLSAFDAWRGKTPKQNKETTRLSAAITPQGVPTQPAADRQKSGRQITEDAANAVLKELFGKR